MSDDIEIGGSVATVPSKLHFMEQDAAALLAPIAASLLVLERRTERYGHVATLSVADAAAIDEAHAALAIARAAVQRLAQTSTDTKGAAQS